MKKETTGKLKIYRALSSVFLVPGVLLLVYMIMVESEPGALPLFLIVAGTMWFLVNQVEIRKQLR